MTSRYFGTSTSGKTDHWEYALTKDGTKVWNRTLPNDESKLTTAQ